MRVCSGIIVVLFVVCIFVNPVFAEGDEVIARFSHALSAEELGNIVDSSGIYPREIYFQDGEIQGGYSLSEGEYVEEAVTHLTEKHRKALSDMIARVDEELGAIRGKNHVRYRMLHKKLVNALDKLSSNNLKVNGVRVDKNSISQDLINSDMLEGVYPVLKSPRRNKENDFRKQNQSSWIDFFIPKAYAGSFYYIIEEEWAPRSGASKTTRYMAYNSFYFPDASGFDSFGGIFTYEHETQVYNKNFADYDNYWSSNLPSAYYDTPFLDTLDNFTIGSSQASSISDNTQYWTYMALTPGTASTAGVIIKGQLGHRYPSWCYNTWCIYADMTTGWLTDYNAPINTQQSWTYNP